MITLLAAGADAAAAADTGLLETFGVNWKLFTFQLINFVIVILVLKKFAFGPITAMLEQRRKRIAEGEEKLKRIETQLAESEESTAAALAKANDDAKRLIEEAKQSSIAHTEEKTQEAIGKAQEILTKAEATAKAERAQMVSELKADFGQLVVSATTAVTGKVLTDDDKKRINQEALTTVEG
ncbi:F0F1 ATP synthase subunit B [Rubritalea sp.]|uniref:F0F1 ATP synthase subunit B n=1 Tax=Rubritalea sp. TaxID=2109375 RepID=UPI003EF6510F